jgi:hypothetical protein
VSPNTFHEWNKNLHFCSSLHIFVPLYIPTRAEMPAQQGLQLSRDAINMRGGTPAIPGLQTERTLCSNKLVKPAKTETLAIAWM